MGKPRTAATLALLDLRLAQVLVGTAVIAARAGLFLAWNRHGNLSLIGTLQRREELSKERPLVNLERRWEIPGQPRPARLAFCK